MKTEREITTLAELLFDRTEGATMDKHTFIHAFKVGYFEGFDDRAIFNKSILNSEKDEITLLKRENERLKETLKALDKERAYWYAEKDKQILSLTQELERKEKEAVMEFGDWLRKQRADVFYGSPTTESLFETFKK